MKYKTLFVCDGGSLRQLNEYYEDGWQFVECVATRPASGICGVYITIKKA